MIIVHHSENFIWTMHSVTLVQTIAMNLIHVRPVFWVADVRKTIDWYVDQLGFEETHYVENWQWGQARKDSIYIMFAKIDELKLQAGPIFTGSIYFNTMDIDAWWNKLKDNGFVYYGIENFEHGMREFAIKDCNGYILQFGQEITE